MPSWSRDFQHRLGLCICTKICLVKLVPPAQNPALQSHRDSEKRGHIEKPFHCSWPKEWSYLLELALKALMLCTLLMVSMWEEMLYEGGQPLLETHQCVGQWKGCHSYLNSPNSWKSFWIRCKKPHYLDMEVHSEMWAVWSRHQSQIAHLGLPFQMRPPPRKKVTTEFLWQHL
jgi:hypothetical protein